MNEGGLCNYKERRDPCGHRTARKRRQNLGPGKIASNFFAACNKLVISRAGVRQVKVPCERGKFYSALIRE